MVSAAGSWPCGSSIGFGAAAQPTRSAHPAISSGSGFDSDNGLRRRVAPLGPVKICTGSTLRQRPHIVCLVTGGNDPGECRALVYERKSQAISAEFAEASQLAPGKKRGFCRVGNER